MDTILKNEFENAIHGIEVLLCTLGRVENHDYSTSYKTEEALTRLQDAYDLAMSLELGGSEESETEEDYG